jgi:hypothetical protein
MSTSTCTRRLVRTCLELYARSPWSVFDEVQDFGFEVPGFSRPFVARFARGADGPTLDFSETQPTAAIGLQAVIVFVRNELIPLEYRRLFRRIGLTPSRGSRSIMFLVLDDGGFKRPPTAREERMALYIVSALQKAWTANTIGPEARDDLSRVPLLRLTGPPHDPTIEMSEIRVMRHDAPATAVD